MDARELILTELRDFCRYDSWRAECDGFTWDDRTFLRTAIVRTRHGDSSAWGDFVARMNSRPEWAAAVLCRLESCGYVRRDPWSDDVALGTLPPQTASLGAGDEEAFLESLREATFYPETPDQVPQRVRPGRTQIMYIEYKGDDLTGPARIGRVNFSQSRRTIYYQDCKFQSLKGKGYKANYFDSENGGWYWISQCRADGQDTLYPGVVEIDEDIREAYWTEVRDRPDLRHKRSFRSEGKYSMKRPQPEKPNHPAAGPRS